MEPCFAVAEQSGLPAQAMWVVGWLRPWFQAGAPPQAVPGELNPEQVRLHRPAAPPTAAAVLPP